MKILITDSDLDGLGCEVVARNSFSNIKVKRVRYETASYEVKRALELNPEVLIIADMWPKDDNGLYNDLINFPGQLMLFDHHVSSQEAQWKIFNRRAERRPVLWLSDKHNAASKVEWQSFEKLVHYNEMDVCFNGEGGCSAMKMNNFFRTTLPMISEVNIYDTTGTVEGLPGALNHLYYELNRAHMREILNRSYLTLTADEWSKVNMIIGRHQSKFEQFKSSLQTVTIDKKRIAYIEANESKAWVAQTLLKENECVIIVDKGSNSVSLRSTIPVCHLVAEKFGGGGHKQASGFKGSPTFDEILEVFNEVL